MALSTQSFTDLVRNQVAAIQAKANSLLDFAIGSIMLAMVESNGGVVLWLQGLILKLLATTRAATSNGSDLDSWMNDFNFPRLAATTAMGPVATFSRFTPSQQAVILAGAIGSNSGAQIETANGSQIYSVIIDTTNPNYNATLGGYVLSAGIASITVPIQANKAGSAGNAVIYAINTLASSIPGVDTVTNTAALTNGKDAEEDPPYRKRFVDYISSLSKATKTAIKLAVESLAENVEANVVENENLDGSENLGFFYVVVDDGSGTPPTSLIDTAANVVDLTRPLTSRFQVLAPTVVTANVVMSITVSSDYDHADVATLVENALETFINTLPLGGTLFFTRLSQVAYDASPGITNVTGITLNGGTSNLTATNQEAIKPGTITIS